MQSFFPALTKIIATLGETSSSVKVLSESLRAGMSGTPFTNKFSFLFVPFLKFLQTMLQKKNYKQNLSAAGICYEFMKTHHLK
jgi:hypothetical protein